MGVYDYHREPQPAGAKTMVSGIPLYERHPEVTPGNPYKAYVGVNADFTADGRMSPRKIFWEDGRTFEIDRIVSVERKASLAAGGAGIRFLSMIRGNAVSLYYEENGLWFVKRRVPLTGSAGGQQDGHLQSQSRLRKV